MAVTVPRVSQGDIAPVQGGTPSYNVNYSGEGFGAGVGQALGQSAQLASDIGYQEQMKANAAQLNQARVQLDQNESSLFDPTNPNSVYQYKGANALKAPAAVNDSLTTAASNIRATLTNPVQQEAFDHMFADHSKMVIDRGNRYALQQNEAYQNQAFQGAVGSSLSSAVTKATAGDTEGSALAQADGINAINQYAKANGEDPAYTQLKIDNFTKGVTTAVNAANKTSVETAIIQQPSQTLQDLSARLGLGHYGAAGSSGDPGAALGVRNNNPGNLQQSGVQWQGGVPSTNPRFAAFATPEHGIRALAVNAQHLQANGAQSVSDLVGQWSPASENGQANTAAYIADVSKAMGVQPGDNVNLQDPAQLTAFTNAIISHENGGNPYSADQVNAGVQAALGKSKLPATHPPMSMGAGGMIVPGTEAAVPIGQLGKSGNPAVDALDPASVVELYNRANAEVNKKQVTNQAAIEQRVRDDTAAFGNGQTVKQPLSLSDFTGAYGDQQGMVRYGAYQANQQLGQDLQTVNTLTPDQMQALSASRHPVPGENFAVKQADQNHLDTAIQQTKAARQKDPALWAMTSGVGGVQPLDMSTPDKLAGSIAARGAAMHTVAQNYQTPYRLLTGDEGAALSQMMTSMPATQKASMLGALSTQLQPDDYGQIVSTLKKDSPTIAIAGQIMGAQKSAITAPGGMFSNPTSMDATTVAQTMLAGDALINPTKADKDDNGAPKFAMPSDGGAFGLRAEWASVVGDAFRGDGDSDMQSFQAFKAMYAGLASKAGVSDGTLDPKIAEQAARATIGNVGEWNGKNVIPPYGMDYNAFKDSANAAWTAQRASVPGADQQDLDAYNLDRVGDGAYAVSNGQAPLRDKNGRPVMIRIAAPAQPQASVGAPARGGKPAAMPTLGGAQASTPSAPHAAAQMPYLEGSK